LGCRDRGSRAGGARIREPLTADSASDAPGEGRKLLVSLDVFDGPLDLLLHLVRERELDIATVSLALVAQQFFDYIAVMDALDVEIAAEYLVIAATLVFLKSKSLLPAIPNEFLTEGDESAEEVEERLRRRLIAYSRYKGVAEHLRERRAEAESYFYREAGDPTSEFAQRFRIVPDKLARALLAALRSAKPEKRTIARERFSIARQMEFVARVVREGGPVEFVFLCRDFDRGGVIATFLAILELIRQRRLAFEQSTPDEPLRLLPFEPVEVHAN
jgi:segregation and condensation protein A